MSLIEHKMSSLVLRIALYLLSLGYFAYIEAKHVGFSIDLIHRDSPLSPFYNPLQSPRNRWHNAFKSAANRLNRRRQKSMLSSSNLPESQVVSDNGEYLIKYSIGSPPREYYGIVDTGSDLTWTQCEPCISCYKQRSPIFNPTTSSTYKNILCTSQQCQLLPHQCSNGNCSYNYGYIAGAFTVGSLATETLTLSSSSGTPVSLKNIVFGCGHNNSGPSEEQAGIFAMGPGSISMVSQIGSSLRAVKFSQCLVPSHTNPSITSKLIFGSIADVTGINVVSIPMVPEAKGDYKVTLEGFTVGNEYVPFYTSNQKTEKGNMLIDSGTPLVILPNDFYNRVELEVKSVISMQPLQGMNPQLCYNSTVEKNVPVITAHFEGGANIKLTAINSFIPIIDGIYCFAMTNTSSEIGLFGNYAQINYLIGFDLEKWVVNFKPTDCTKYH